MPNNRQNRQPPQNDPKCAEMRENAREVKKSPLTPRQESALPHIITAPTITQAARNAGINQATLRRWLKDENFRQELTHERQQSAALARQEIQGLMLRSISVMSEALEAPDISIRLRAARYTLSFALQLAETEKLRAELQDLQDLITTLPQPATPQPATPPITPAPPGVCGAHIHI